MARHATTGFVRGKCVFTATTLTYNERPTKYRPKVKREPGWRCPGCGGWLRVELEKCVRCEASK